MTDIISSQINLMIENSYLFSQQSTISLSYTNIRYSGWFYGPIGGHQEWKGIWVFTLATVTCAYMQYILEYYIINIRYR